MADYSDFAQAIDAIRSAKTPLNEIYSIFFKGMDAVLENFPRNNCYANLSPQQKAHALICCLLQYEERVIERTPGSQISPRQMTYNSLADIFGEGMEEARSPTELGKIIILTLKDIQKIQNLEPGPLTGL